MTLWFQFGLIMFAIAREPIDCDRAIEEEKDEKN